jgi:hypothetical protein
MRVALSSSMLVGALMTAMFAQAAVEEEQKAAPLGLQWGMSSMQVRELGVDLKDFPFKDYGTSYTASKLPKVIADTETVVLSFGFDDRLWRIAMRSKAFTNDPYGSAVRDRYDELSNELAEKYGHGEQNHHTGEGFYAKADNFVFALSTGKAWYYTNYNSNVLSVQLSIRAQDASIAFYQILFESKTLRSDFEKSKKMHEKDSL